MIENLLNIIHKLFLNRKKLTIKVVGMTLNEESMKKLPPVKVFNPYTGKEEMLVPKKVWKIRDNLKMGQFQCPHTGRFFKAKVPIDYPEIN